MLMGLTEHGGELGAGGLELGASIGIVAAHLDLFEGHIELKGLFEKVRGDGLLLFGAGGPGGVGSGAGLLIELDAVQGEQVFGAKDGIAKGTVGVIEPGAGCERCLLFFRGAGGKAIGVELAGLRVEGSFQSREIDAQVVREGEEGEVIRIAHGNFRLCAREDLRQALEVRGVPAAQNLHGWSGAGGILSLAMSDSTLTPPVELAEEQGSTTPSSAVSKDLDGAVLEATEKTSLDIVEIMSILPHRYPLLLIDRVLEMERKKRIVALKNVTANEPHFTGHFPDYPIMPGVLIVEAIAQAGGALLLTEIPDRDEKLMVFTGIEAARFRRAVVPGDQLRIEVTVLNWRRTAVKLSGKATVDGAVACEATIMCMLVPRGNRKAAAGTGTEVEAR